MNFNIRKSKVIQGSVCILFFILINKISCKKLTVEECQEKWQSCMDDMGPFVLSMTCDSIINGKFGCVERTGKRKAVEEETGSNNKSSIPIWYKGTKRKKNIEGISTTNPPLENFSQKPQEKIGSEKPQVYYSTTFRPKEMGRSFSKNVKSSNSQPVLNQPKSKSKSLPNWFTKNKIKDETTTEASMTSTAVNKLILINTPTPSSAQAITPQNETNFTSVNVETTPNKIISTTQTIWTTSAPETLPSSSLPPLHVIPGGRGFSKKNKPKSNNTLIGVTERPSGIGNETQFMSSHPPKHILFFTSKPFFFSSKGLPDKNNAQKKAKKAGEFGIAINSAKIFFSYKNSTEKPPESKTEQSTTTNTRLNPTTTIKPQFATNKTATKKPKKSLKRKSNEKKKNQEIVVDKQNKNKNVLPSWFSKKSKPEEISTSEKSIVESSIATANITKISVQSGKVIEEKLVGKENISSTLSPIQLQATAEIEIAEKISTTKPLPSQKFQNKGRSFSRVKPNQPKKQTTLTTQPPTVTDKLIEQIQTTILPISKKPKICTRKKEMPINKKIKLPSWYTKESSAERSQSEVEVTPCIEEITFTSTTEKPLLPPKNILGRGFLNAVVINKELNPPTTEGTFLSTKQNIILSTSPIPLISSPNIISTMITLQPIIQTSTQRATPLLAKKTGDKTNSKEKPVPIPYPRNGTKLPILIPVGKTLNTKPNHGKSYKPNTASKSKIDQKANLSTPSPSKQKIVGKKIPSKGRVVPKSKKIKENEKTKTKIPIKKQIITTKSPSTTERPTQKLTTTQMPKIEAENKSQNTKIPVTTTDKSVGITEPNKAIGRAFSKEGNKSGEDEEMRKSQPASKPSTHLISTTEPSIPKIRVDISSKNPSTTIITPPTMTQGQVLPDSKIISENSTESPKNPSTNIAMLYEGITMTPTEPPRRTIDKPLPVTLEKDTSPKPNANSTQSDFNANKNSSQELPPLEMITNAPIIVTEKPIIVSLSPPNIVTTPSTQSKGRGFNQQNVEDIPHLNENTFFTKKEQPQEYEGINNLDTGKNAWYVPEQKMPSTPPPLYNSPPSNETPKPKHKVWGPLTHEPLVPKEYLAEEPPVQEEQHPPPLPVYHKEIPNTWLGNEKVIPRPYPSMHDEDNDAPNYNRRGGFVPPRQPQQRTSPPNYHHSEEHHNPPNVLQRDNDNYFSNGRRKAFQENNARRGWNGNVGFNRNNNKQRPPVDYDYDHRPNFNSRPNKPPPINNPGRDNRYEPRRTFVDTEEEDNRGQRNRPFTRNRPQNNNEDYHEEYTPPRQVKVQKPQRYNNNERW